jgi:hypothetical protein
MCKEIGKENNKIYTEKYKKIHNNKENELFLLKNLRVERRMIYGFT